MASDPIVQNIIKEFEQRSEIGQKKYGTTLSENNLTPEEWIEHAKQELMDCILYLETLKGRIKQS
jgi:hypothetical protein